MLRNVYYYKVVLENEVEVFFGEYSLGWKFIFKSHNHLYETSKRGINRFLKLHKYDLFVEYRDNQAYSTTRDPLRAEPHSVLGPLSVMPLNHFNKIAQPSNPEHPYYHPDRIIY